MNQVSPSYACSIDPYVYQTLQEIQGKMVIVQTTTRDTVTGRLVRVLPDHIVVESGGSPFFIRTQQIVWVIPKG